MGALIFWLSVGLLLALGCWRPGRSIVETAAEGTTSAPAGRCPATPGNTAATPWPATAPAT